MHVHPAHSPYHKIMGQENTIDLVIDFIGDFLEKPDFENIIILKDTNCRM